MINWILIFSLALAIIIGGARGIQINNFLKMEKLEGIGGLDADLSKKEIRFYNRMKKKNKFNKKKQ